MGASEILDEIATKTGWDDNSKALLLTQFIDSLAVENRLLDPTQIEGEFRQFLRNQALDEGLTEQDLDDDNQEDNPEDMGDDE